METYTISFFGHRDAQGMSEIENHLENLLRFLITEHEYVEFLIGREGDFDIFAASVIKRAIRKYSRKNTSFVLVMPYPKAEFINNKQYYLDYYDEIEICTESARSHFKSAIQTRNNYMIDRSNLVVCYIQRESGGAYKALQYAKKHNCKVINLADESSNNYGGF